ILALDAFRAGTVDTGFLDREGARITESLADEPERAIPQSTIANQSAIRNPQSAMGTFDPWDAHATVQRSHASTPKARRRAAISGQDTLTAPMPATVIKVRVQPGDAVKKGDVVVLLEAMKMELPVRAPGDAVVASVHCQEGELVQADAVLVEL